LPNRLTAGERAPDEVNIVIEIPRGSNIKYEIDEKTGAIFVDRFLYTPTYYPFNYGFIPGTLGEDGDPLDSLVVTEEAVFPMSVIRSRPIGVLMMEDEKGSDAKIVAVPARHVDPSYSDVDSIKELPEFTKKQIEHFFSHYKESEPHKFVKIGAWKDHEYAKDLIRASLDRVPRRKRSAKR
jgi:inorganic pyrophosphatase